MAITPSNDFTTFEDSNGNTHARLSLRKTAELLMVNQSSITRALQGDALFDVVQAKNLVLYGFAGDALVPLVTHYVTSSRVSNEVKKHNADLLQKISVNRS